jgi:ferredoxin
MTVAPKKASLLFMPSGTRAEVDAGTKILVGARQAGVPIRFMCASLRCGTCGVKVDASRGTLSPQVEDELAMLRRLKLPQDGSVRMACRTRVESGEIVVDLDFQDSYDPADNADFEDA